MIRFGFSVAAALLVAAPVWASDPPPVFSDGPPAPVAFPASGLAAPEMLPPIASGVPGLGAAVAPEWYGPPGAPPLVPGATGVDPCDFPFDPCYPFLCSGPGKVAAASWVRGDWLFWGFRKTPVPVLVATGNPNLPNPAIPGRGNFTPLGAGPRDLGQFNGVRLTVGHWFDRDGEFGAEFSGFVFGREGSALTFSDRTGSPVVSSPVIGITGAPAAYDFAFPGRFTGALAVQTATQLYAGEANLLHRWYGNGRVSFDTMLGYRYLQFNERIDLLGRTTNLGAVGTFNGGLLPQGVTVLTWDSFRGTTEFHGGQIGGRLEVRRDMFTLTAFG
ncbi:MAG TPA: BBP7 family outer membrane beta-barrel protein, partial [Gemmata sp.]